MIKSKNTVFAIAVVQPNDLPLNTLGFLFYVQYTVIQSYRKMNC